MIEAVARATGRAVDSSVSLGASRQRPVRPEPRCRPGADPAPCLRARRHVLLRDLHLANHGHCGRPGGHRRAWARRVGARQPDLRCYRCYPRSAPPSYGLSNEPRNCNPNPETGSAAAVFGYPGTAQIDALGWHCRCQNLITPCARRQSRCWLPAAVAESTRGARSRIDSRGNPAKRVCPPKEGGFPKRKTSKTQNPTPDPLHRASDTNSKP